MRLHTNVLTFGNVIDAARAADAACLLTERGSRSHQRSFDVKLRGESKRRPNFYDGDGSYAATWDQWGVFFGYLYRLDPYMVAGSVKRPNYADNTDFGLKTFGRFRQPGFPADYHGDHVFRFAGVPMTQACTKCSARFTWQPTLN